MMRFLFGCLLIPGCQAAALNFLFQMDTSAFGAGPYSLSFALVNGGAPASTVSVTHLDLGGGSLNGGPVLTGGVSFSADSFQFQDSALVNQAVQSFTPGTTLSFFVNASLNNFASFADTFSFAILDDTGTEIPTTGLASEVLYVELTDPVLIEAYASAGTPGFPQPLISEVPEPSTAALAAAGLAVAVWRRRTSTP